MIYKVQTFYWSHTWATDTKWLIKRELCKGFSLTFKKLAEARDEIRTIEQADEVAAWILWQIRSVRNAKIIDSKRLSNWDYVENNLVRKEKR